MNSNSRAWSPRSWEALGATPLSHEEQLTTVGGRFILVGPMFSSGFVEVIRGFRDGFFASW